MTENIIKLLTGEKLGKKEYDDDYTFDNISFINENSGYGIIEGAPHMTSDGGTTWVKTSDTVNITDISFASVSVGFALIDGKTYQTSDDGVTWEKKNSDMTLIKSPL